MMKPWKSVVVLVPLLGLLSACGGGEGDSSTAGPPKPPTAIPDSASASAEGFIDFLKVLVGFKLETAEPLSVDGVTAKTSETAEPDPSI